MKTPLRLLTVSLIMCTISLCGCSKEENITEQTDTETVIGIAEKDTNKKDTNKKDKNKTDKNKIESDILIEDLENINIELSDPSKIELEDMPYTSGKVVDTSFDFSVYELDEKDNNESAQLFDGDYEKYMFNLNNYVIELVHIKLNRVIRYLDDDSYVAKYDTTIEDDLQDIDILLRGLDAKNTVIIAYFTHDVELLNLWNKFYQEMVLVRSQLEDTDKTNCTELDISSLGTAATSLSSLLNDRTFGYGYITAQDVADSTRNNVD